MAVSYTNRCLTPFPPIGVLKKPFRALLLHSTYQDVSSLSITADAQTFHLGTCRTIIGLKGNKRKVATRTISFKIKYDLR